MTEKYDFQALIDASREGVRPSPVDNHENLLFLPLGNNGSGQVFDLQNYAGTPRRKCGSIIVYDAASLNAFIEANKDAGTVAVYIDRDITNPKIIAVLNDHGVTPGWRDLRATIELRKTPQWVKWQNMDGKMVSQTEFAEFIEDNLQDIAEPEGATMLEIVTYLQATRTTDFKSGVRLSNGNVQFVNVENTEAKVGAGKIEVPETFKIAVTPFLGLALFAIPVRFRYRISDGKLTMGLKLQRIENLMNQVLDDVIKDISCANLIYGRP
ncbi:MAG TPA: DUF2303 family protein [Halothiobacillus sp.]|nr:DUF2303 family protein [Halothiobacillus sp.]